jgi:hypothetical protein
VGHVEELDILHDMMFSQNKEEEEKKGKTYLDVNITDQKVSLEPVALQKRFDGFRGYASAYRYIYYSK